MESKGHAKRMGYGSWLVRWLARAPLWQGLLPLLQPGYAAAAARGDGCGADPGSALSISQAESLTYIKEKAKPGESPRPVWVLKDRSIAF